MIRPDWQKSLLPFVAVLCPKALAFYCRRCRLEDLENCQWAGSCKAEWELVCECCGNHGTCRTGNWRRPRFHLQQSGWATVYVATLCPEWQAAESFGCGHESAWNAWTALTTTRTFMCSSRLITKTTCTVGFLKCHGGDHSKSSNWDFLKFPRVRSNVCFDCQTFSATAIMKIAITLVAFVHMTTAKFSIVSWVFELRKYLVVLEKLGTNLFTIENLVATSMLNMSHGKMNMCGGQSWQHFAVHTGLCKAWYGIWLETRPIHLWQFLSASNQEYIFRILWMLSYKIWHPKRNNIPCDPVPRS